MYILTLITLSEIIMLRVFNELVAMMQGFNYFINDYIPGFIHSLYYPLTNHPISMHISFN